MPRPDEQHKVDPPKSDNDYFERMSRVIFMAGLNWRTLEKKWPGIKTAFADFDIDQVAEFGEPEIDGLMKNSDVIRNLPKIRAIISNAQELQQIIKEQGSVKDYLRRLRSDGGEEGLRKAVSKRFAFLGPGTTTIWLFSVGEELPQATQEWEARHGG